MKMLFFFSIFSLLVLSLFGTGNYQTGAPGEVFRRLFQIIIPFLLRKPLSLMSPISRTERNSLHERRKFLFGEVPTVAPSA